LVSSTACRHQKELKIEMTKKECMKIHPEVFDLVIRSQDEWSVIAEAVNEGIDGYLEAFCKSTFDHTTGKCEIHPEEMHILLRRLAESDEEEAYLLREAIISVMKDQG